MRTTLVGDLLTPVAAFLKLRHERKGAAFLLESVEGGAVRGRFSMIGLDPDLVWRCQDGVAAIDRHALEPHQDAFVAEDRAPAREPARADRGKRACRLGRRPAAHGGRASSAISATTWCAQMERLPSPNPDVLGVPDADPGPADRDGRVRRGAATRSR